MYKEPISYLVGLKALAWDLEQTTFVSPARPQFTWSPGGLQMCTCPKCGDEPHSLCTCGLYATFDLSIALEYIGYSPISPIFLVEASGITHVYSDGFRSQELSIHAVAPNDSQSSVAKLATSQASNYFQVPLVNDVNSMILLMELFNKKNLGDDYRPRNEFVKSMPIPAIEKLLSQRMEETQNVTQT